MIRVILSQLHHETGQCSLHQKFFGQGLMLSVIITDASQYVGVSSKLLIYKGSVYAGFQHAAPQWLACRQSAVSSPYCEHVSLNSSNHSSKCFSLM